MCFKIAEAFWSNFEYKKLGFAKIELINKNPSIITYGWENSRQNLKIAGIRILLLKQNTQKFEKPTNLSKNFQLFRQNFHETIVLVSRKILAIEKSLD